MDLAISHWINNTFGENKAFAVFWKIITYLGSEWFLMALFLVFLCMKRTRKMAIYMIIAIGGTWVINNLIIKEIVARPRPFITDPTLTNMCELAGMELPDEYSMASGHASISMAVAMSIFMFNKKWGGISFAYPFMVGISRICLCVHYLTDVVAGWCLGAIVGVCVYYVLNFLVKKFILDKEKRNGKDSSSVSEQTQD